MESALEEIEFLSLSANRVEVLALLAEEGHTRSDLAERVDASQPTLGRILRDLRNRKWIVHDGERYVATATGRLVLERFTNLLEVLETEAELRPIVEWLPTEEMGFDLARLRDATITVPSQTRPNAPVSRVLDLLRGADRVLVASYAFNGQSLDVIRRRVVEDGRTFEGVFSASAIDALAGDERLRRRLRDLLDADGAAIRIRDAEIPLAVTVADDRVHLLLRDHSGVIRAGLDTDDDAVREWAATIHDRYWRDATPLDAETLASADEE